jgi:CRP/FNR family transcriptional regulator, cyclic AMP receptor protein
LIESYLNPRDMTDYWHLRDVDWLATLGPAEVARVRRSSTTRVYEAGQSIFEPSRHPEQVYLLEEGLIRIFRASPRGDEYTLDYVRPRGLFGEVSVLADRPRESFAEARRRSRVLVIPRRVFVRAVRSSAAALYAVTKKMGRSLLTCRSQAEDLAFRSVRSRLAHLLLRLGEQFGQPADGRVVIGLSLSQGELATLIGATRQTVSATLAEMAEDEIIERRRGQTLLLDPEALRRLAELPQPG